jgi:hypothetical protein
MLDFDATKKSYSYTPKNDPRDRVRVAVGDEKDPSKFQPQTKIERFDNEVNFSIRLKDDDSDIAQILTDGEKIKWVKSKKESYFENKDCCEQHPEGAFDFDVLLQEPPKDGVLDFTIVGKDLEAPIRQAPYTEIYKTGDEIFGVKAGKVTDIAVYDEKGKLLLERVSEAVIGSYPLYKKSQKINKSGGKEYGTNQIGMVYYPYLIDADGNKVKAKNFVIEYDEKTQTGTARIEIQEGLKYPVLVDPTIGYDTAGASVTYVTADWLTLSAMNRTTSADGASAVSILIHAKQEASGTSAAWQGAIYKYNTSSPYHELIGTTAEGAINSTTAQWWQLDFASPLALDASTDYCATAFTDYDDTSQIGIYYNSGSTGDSRNFSTLTYNEFPDNTVAVGAASSFRFSIYARYIYANTVDYNQEWNQNNENSMAGYTGYSIVVGQSFTGDGKKITEAYIYCNKGYAQTPIGNVYLKIYAHTGTFGTSSLSTGSALATSDAIDATTLENGNPLVLTKFTFSGANQITLTNGTYYVLRVEFSGGDGSNHINVGFDQNGTHAGNKSVQSYGDSYYAEADYDLIFYVIGEEAGEVIITRTPRSGVINLACSPAIV